MIKRFSTFSYDDSTKSILLKENALFRHVNDSNYKRAREWFNINGDDDIPQSSQYRAVIDELERVFDINPMSLECVDVEFIIHSDVGDFAIELTNISSDGINTIYYMDGIIFITSDWINCRYIDREYIPHLVAMLRLASRISEYYQ